MNCGTSPAVFYNRTGKFGAQKQSSDEIQTSVSAEPLKKNYIKKYNTRY